MENATEWKPEYYSQTTLKSFGFTAKMIETMLSEPILKDNPHYRCAAPMKLWLITEVEVVMQTDEFKEAVQKRESRRQGAAKAVETKRAKLHAEIEAKIQKIKVEVLTIGQLRNEAIADRQAWYDMDWENCCDAASADEPTIKRWMVNYVRHNLTSYDDVLYRMSGKVGCQDEYLTYKFAVLDKIAEAYPKLKQECNQQKQRTQSEHDMRMAYLTRK